MQNTHKFPKDEKHAPTEQMSKDAGRRLYAELRTEKANGRFPRARLEQLSKYLKFPGHDFFSLRTDGTLQAFAVGNAQGTEYSLDLVVSDGHGAGTRLMNYIFDKAEQDGFEGVFFTSYSDDRSTQKKLDDFYNKTFVHGNKPFKAERLDGWDGYKYSRQFK